MKKKYNAPTFKIFIVVICLILGALRANANESLFYKEVNLIGGYSDNEKWIGRSDTLKNSVGFEDYRKFSGDYGDFLTTDLQMRLAYDSLEPARDAWAVEIHNAWLEFKLGSSNKFRIGHFDPSFGLEPLIDTHGTILQTIMERNIGFNKDWGVTLKGIAPFFDYEASLQLGSGMSIYRRDESFLATARAGSPASGNFQYGLSVLYGNVLETMGMKTIPRNELVSDEAVLKKRIGLDGQYLFGPCLIKAEADYGRNNHEDVAGYFGEIDYTIPHYQNLELELQYKSWINDLGERGSDDSTLSVGASYKLNQSITMRGAFIHDVNLMKEDEDDKFLLQVYYYGL